MKPLIVGISDCRVSADPEVSLVTYALGSCIAVMVYEPVRKVGGMLHYMLPDSSLDQSKAAQNPYMFGDTGIPRLFEQVRGQGANSKSLVVRLAGGAQVLDKQNVFEIGRRNYLAAKKALWKLGLFVSSEAVGGEISRTVRLDMSTGKSWLREGGRPESEFAERRASHSAPQAGKPIAAARPAPASSISAGGGLWDSGF